MSPPRLAVNLDAVGAGIDRLLATPLGQLLGMAAPELHQAIREVREDLPGAAVGILDAAQARATGALDRRAAAAVRKVTGKKKKPPKRLKR